jgi:acetyl-CoA carboxylase biotin carboxyl carrier protein
MSSKPAFADAGSIMMSGVQLRPLTVSGILVCGLSEAQNPVRIISIVQCGEPAGHSSCIKFEEVVEMADVTMPMNGKVIAVKVEVGQSIQEDDEIIIIEAMKMELPVVAPGAGTVKEIRAKVGESYQVDEVVAVIE